MEFVNIYGNTIPFNYGEAAGTWTPFSSTGPTMAGLLKPDISAPGLNVISALSSYYLEEHPIDEQPNTWDVSHMDVNGRTYPWGAMSGTSMSTPVVAGAIALWLEAKPTLTKEEIMGVLERTSRHPEPELSYPNNRYGYGKTSYHHCAGAHLFFLFFGLLVSLLILFDPVHVFLVKFDLVVSHF